MTQDIGPTYQDVQEAVERCRDRWGVGIHFIVRPPLLIKATGKYTSWQVLVEGWYLRGDKKHPFGSAQTYGRGGSWRTMPAAMWHAVRVFDERLQEDERWSEAQAAF